MSRLRFRLSAASLALALGAGLFGAVWSCSLYSQQDEAYSAGEDGVTMPRLLAKVEPGYTEEARAAKLQGTAVLGAEVWPDGQAHNLRVKRSLDPGLDAKAIEAIQQWRFKPGEKDGQPVKVKVNVEVNFRLL